MHRRWKDGWFSGKLDGWTVEIRMGFGKVSGRLDGGNMSEFLKK